MNKQAPILIFVVLALSTILLSIGKPVMSNDPLAEAVLEIQGNQLTIQQRSSWVFNVGEPITIKTCYGTDSICELIGRSDPRIAGLKVLAELTGPALSEPMTYETNPGGAFIFPGFQQEGEYRLENIRLVSAVTGDVIGSADPPVVVIQVSQIMITSATVQRLTLEDLQARGIDISQENFQAYNFAVGFAIGEELVTIELPVLYDGNETVSPLASKPGVILDADVSDEFRGQIERWQPPNLIPFRLELHEPSYLDIGEEENEDLPTVPLFGALVIPGSVSFLNQFFEAQLIVANGAKEESGVLLDNVKGAINLPDGQVLRLAETTPPVAPGQPISVVFENDSVIPPGEQGAAAWTVEGLVAGTHLMSIDIEGEIVRQDEEPYPVKSQAQAAVEVVDARFHLTFAHPDVVRADEAYSLFVTVTNMSRAVQEEISVNLSDQTIVNTELAPEQPERHPVSLEVGESWTFEYRLISEITGQVVASRYQDDSPGSTGAITLFTGVGELGIPLSPASLVMPRFSERLAAPYNGLEDGELLSANVRLLGLAYSLAVAPAGMTPAGLPRIIKSDVEQRAVDIAEAGQRTFLGEELLESLEVLALDQLGNRHQLKEFDALRRSIRRAPMQAVALATKLRNQQEARGLSARELLDHFALTTSYADPYIAATFIPDDEGEAPVLEVRYDDPQSGATLYTSHPCENQEMVREVPFGEIYSIDNGDGAAPLALIGHVGVNTDDPAKSQELLVQIHNPTTNEIAGQLVLIVPDLNGGFRKIDYGTVTVEPGALYAARVGANVEDFLLFHPTLETYIYGAPEPTVTMVELPPFTLIGAVQDYKLDANGGNRYGNGITYLFNRPPDPASAADPTSYVIHSQFNAPDGVTRESDNKARAAFIQASQRVVNVRYAKPVSALIEGGVQLVTHEHQKIDVLDRHGSSIIGTIPYPKIERYSDLEPNSPADHFGGLVEGRVIRGSGVGAKDATVQLLRNRRLLGISDKVVLDLVAEVLTEDDGSFYFDFVEEPHSDPKVNKGYTLRAIVPADPENPIAEPAQTQQVSSYIRRQNQLHQVNIALLGRGTVKGTLLYYDPIQSSEQPVVGGEVTVSSTLFQETLTVTVADDGTFSAAGMPVGPLTLTGRDPAGRVVYETVGLEQPGDEIEVDLYIQVGQPPGLGTVIAHVYKQAAAEPGDEPPAPVALGGARVAVYSNSGQLIAEKETDSYGGVRFNDVPEGQVSLQAADFDVSRASVFTDLMLTADETAEVNLVLHETVTKQVCGRVLLYDPIINENQPFEGAVVFISGPGMYTTSDSDGKYCLEDVPAQDLPWKVDAIDQELGLQGYKNISVTADLSEPIMVEDIVLQAMTGSVDGIVLDHLGRPVPGVPVVLTGYVRYSRVAFGEVETIFDGTFSFDSIPARTDVTAVAHVDDGLTRGEVGSIGEASTRVVYGGHRAFMTVPLRGSGLVNIHTFTGDGNVDCLIYYKPTYYSELEKRIRLKGSYVENETNANGELELELPVGEFKIVAYDPFSGYKEVSGHIDYPGQIVDLEIELAQSSTVTGTVIDVDGTPVAGIEVELQAGMFKPQPQSTDQLGQFRFELVPEGTVTVTAAGMAGSVERVGRANGIITAPGEPIDLSVQLRAQGSVKGRVVDENGDGVGSVRYYVVEQSYPGRRLPASPNWYWTDSDGSFELSHVYAGEVKAVVWDGASRMVSVKGEITNDWSTADLGQIVLSQNVVGAVGITVRDPDTGSLVPDCQVELTIGFTREMTVTDADGYALYEALPLGSYSAYVFHAPTGRAGRSNSISLQQGDTVVERTIYLDKRGEIDGTLYDDEDKTVPVTGGTVKLSGSTAAGPLTALATTRATENEEGTFSFKGVPEGTFSLVAWSEGSPRIAESTVDLTASAPTATVALVLEAAGEVHFRLFENLSSGVIEVDPGSSFSVRLQQNGYDFTRIEPIIDGSGHHLFVFPDVLLSRPGTLSVQELSGEQRTGSWSGSLSSVTVAPYQDGSADYPFQVLLHPKGDVVVTVLDSDSNPLQGAGVTVYSSGVTHYAVTNASGVAIFYAVPAGDVQVTVLAGSVGAQASDKLELDDQVLDFQLQLEPTVSVTGMVCQPKESPADPCSPQSGAMVEMTRTDCCGTYQMMVTDDNGVYTSGQTTAGQYSFRASVTGSEAIGIITSYSVIAEGTDPFPIPEMTLDASPPQVLSIVPPPNMKDVSITAPVVITFSEPLHPFIVANLASYFELKTGSESYPIGSWSTEVIDYKQVVRFNLSNGETYESDSSYSLIIKGTIEDTVGRRLNEDGTVTGSVFWTSDVEGPEIVSIEPDISRPVDPEGFVRFDFNEAVTFCNEVSVSPVIFKYQRLDGTWSPAFDLDAGAYYLTRDGYSIQVELPDLEFESDSLQRQIDLRDVCEADNLDNVLDSDRLPAFFRIYDSEDPVIESVPNPGGQDGILSQGIAYSLVPKLVESDGVTIPDDIDRVNYYSEDPEAVTDPHLVYSATVDPYDFSFPAVYDPATGGNLDFWVQATDTSTNESNIVMVDMQVQPNQAPTMTGITAAAVAPVPGNFYAGSTVQVLLLGLDDQDSSKLTVTARLIETATDSLLDEVNGVELDRPSSVWSGDFTVELTLPVDVDEETGVTVEAFAVDTQNAATPIQTFSFTVADDTHPPQVQSLLARSVKRDEIDTVFYLDDSIIFELRASDLETAIESVSVSFSCSSMGEPEVYTVSGSDSLYRTTEVAIPAECTSLEGTPVAVTATAVDFGANPGSVSLNLTLFTQFDPFAPAVEWLTPWQGALWPAGYTHPETAEGVPILLRARATDLDGDENNPVPGRIREVNFRGPVLTAEGALEIGSAVISGVEFDTDANGVGIYQALVYVPNGIEEGTQIPFAAEAVDGGLNPTTRYVYMEARTPRKVYAINGVTATVLDDEQIPATDGDPDGPVFLLDGATLSLYPPEDGSTRQLSSLCMYAGGSDTGTLNVNGSKLIAPPVGSHDSVPSFHPLAIEVAEVLAVGAECSIDMTGSGLLGSDAGVNSVVLEGESRSYNDSGGSHGGLGVGPYPGSIYDSIRDPFLPGGGGDGAHSANLGGNGGGVIRIFAGSAQVHLAGDIRADGGDCGSGGAGAGGSIRLVAGYLEGEGLIAANGGGADSYESGGGGGRVSVSYRELGDFDLATQIVAEGGRRTGTNHAGAGTIYVEQLDPATGEATGIGDLLVRNPVSSAPIALTLLPSLSSSAPTSVDLLAHTMTFAKTEARGDLVGDTLMAVDTGVEPLPIVGQLLVDSDSVRLTLDATDSEMQSLQAATSFHSRSRFASVSAAGTTRVVADGDLEIGADGTTTTLNDRLSINLSDDSRFLLRGEVPEITLSTDVPASESVLYGDTIAATWSVTDWLGLVDATQSWSADQSLVEHTYPDEPLSVGPTQANLYIPGDAIAGGVSIELEVTNRAGRVGHEVLTWDLQENNPPQGSLVVSDVIVGAGSSFTAEVQAEDAEGLKSVELVLVSDPPVVEPIGSVLVSGREPVSVPIEVAVIPTAPDTTLTVQARITDICGAETETDVATVTVTRDSTAPSVELTIYKDGEVVEGDTFKSGDILTFELTATDEVEVASFDITLAGEPVPCDSSSCSFVWTAPPVEVATPFQLKAVATDPAGNPGDLTRDLTVEPSFNPDAPLVTILCPLDGDYAVPDAELAVSFHIVDPNDGDNIYSYQLIVDDEPVGSPVIEVNQSSYTGSISWTPPDDGQTSFRIGIEAIDAGGNVGLSEVTLNVPSGTVLTGDQTLSSSYSGEVLFLAAGTFSASQTLSPASITLVSGAVLRNLNVVEPVVIDTAGSVKLSCGASIDVSGRGYPAGQSYPEESTPTASKTGGSHMGYGGDGVPGDTYGSVYFPQENGAGGGPSYGLRGGGAVYIKAVNISLDGEILADGESATQDNQSGGAGGSIWVVAIDSITGAGAISANGGSSTNMGSGGGGAIAIEYGKTLSEQVEGNLSAVAPGSWPMGGAGTVYLRPRQELGDLIIENNNKNGQMTELPAMGSGTVVSFDVDYQKLDTGLTETIQPYFVGHWLEISDPDGNVRGIWRISNIDGVVVTLEEGGTSFDIESGYRWQGVYRFNEVTLKDNAKVNSQDPIYAGNLSVEGAEMDPAFPYNILNSSLKAQSVTVSSLFITNEIRSTSLTVDSGGVLKQNMTLSSDSPNSLYIEVSENLTVEAGGRIDVTGFGYPAGQSYFGETIPASGNTGGSHMGFGWIGVPGNTYGSVYYPQENGAGGGPSYGLRGGGAIHIIAGSISLGGEILANGESATDKSGGAGGSIWIEVANSITGAGTISANGGSSVNRGNGGGGAIAIEYGDSLSLQVGVTLSAFGTYPNGAGGAGTVYLLQAGHEHGDLYVDNGPGWGHETQLPSLGRGSVVSTNGAGTFETGLGSPIPDYFVGHWVEVASQSGELRGRWRIASISGTEITLKDPDSSGFNFNQDDLWSGVYLFGKVINRKQAKLSSADKIKAQSIEIMTYSFITHPQLESLTLETETLTIHQDASINATSRGYQSGSTYPGEDSPSNSLSGGSHMGYGGIADGTPGSTYGSVYLPQEHGAAGKDSSYGLPGGGVVRIVTSTLSMLGTANNPASIYANGGFGSDSHYRGGAGGSIWITADTILGTGRILADGGWTSNASNGSGGGGAIAIEYGEISDSIELAAVGGSNDRKGGAGTVYLLGPNDTYGELIVDNASTNGSQTVLPALGSGDVLVPGLSASLVTGLDHHLQPYFVGNWIEVFDSSNVSKGIQQIESISCVDDISGTVVCTLGLDGDISFTDKDTWRGVYRFDRVRVRRYAKLVVNDLDDFGELYVDNDGVTSVQLVNRSEPRVLTDPALWSIEAHSDSYWISAADGTITDDDGISSVTINVDGQSPVAVSLNGQGGFDPVAVVGLSGSLFHIVAVDGHPVPLQTVAFNIGTLPANLTDPVVLIGTHIDLVEVGGVYTVQGVAGAVADPEPPISLTVTVSGGTATAFTGDAAADGSFTIEISGSSGDLVSLTATDGHPEPRSTTVTVGSIAGNEAPVLSGEINTSYEAPGNYVVNVPAGAITDQHEPITLRIDHTESGMSWTDQIASGGATTIVLSGADISMNDQVTLTATDAHTEPASQTMTLSLPADNYGPPVVATGSIDTLPMGLGYQVLGSGAWAEDEEWPLTVTLSVDGDPGWQSDPITVDAGEDLYSIVVGNPGDTITMVVTDSHPQAPQSTDPIVLGQLPALGVSEVEVTMDGHTVTRLRDDQLALLDGGLRAARISDGTLWTPYNEGLTAASDIHNADQLGDELVAVDGGRFVTWWRPYWSGSESVLHALDLSTGTFTRMQAIGDDFLLLAEETEGARLYRVSCPSFREGPDSISTCRPTVSLLLPDTAGLHALEILPMRPAGTVGVVVDNPIAEIHQVDMNDPNQLGYVGAIDMPLSYLPVWAQSAGADLFVGGDDGSIELWRSTDTGFTITVSWQSSYGAVTSAVRIGESLWLGTQTGLVEQLAIRDPSDPISLGAYDIGYPVRDMIRSGTETWVAATTADDLGGRLVRLLIDGVVTGIPLDQVIVGHKEASLGRVTWVRVAPLENDIAEVSVEWSDSTVDTCTTPQQGCTLSVLSDLTSPPLIRFTGTNGVTSAPFVVPSSSLRSFKPADGSSMWNEISLPHSGVNCDVRSGTHGGSKDASGAGVDWVAYVDGALNQVLYGYAGGRDLTWQSLSISGNPVEVFDGWYRLLVAANDFEIWDLDGQGAGNPYEPVNTSNIVLFGADPIAAATYGAYWYPDDLLLAADNPGRYAILNPSSSTPDVDDVVLPDLEGNILDLTETYADVLTLYVLTDAGVSGRLYAFDISNLTAPQPISSIDLSGTAPGTKIEFNGTTSYLIVLRKGWGIDFFGLDLSQLGSVPVAGNSQDIHWTENGIAVAAGSLGIALVSDPFGTPTVSFVQSNQRTPGNAVRFSDKDSVVTTSGISWVDIGLLNLVAKTTDEGEGTLVNEDRAPSVPRVVAPAITERETRR